MGKEASGVLTGLTLYEFNLFFLYPHPTDPTSHLITIILFLLPFVERTDDPSHETKWKLVHNPSWLTPARRDPDGNHPFFFNLIHNLELSLSHFLSQ
jgi:hypothetical protein